MSQQYTDKSKLVDMARIYRLTVLYLFLALTSAELVQFSPCDGNRASHQCTVSNVDISPCPEASTNEPCRVKRGKSAAISFDFTPGVNADELETRAYWVNAVATLPWIGMETNACLSTACPVTAGNVAHFNSTLEIAKHFAVRMYKVQWRVWDEDDTIKCCFTTKIRLV